MDRIILVVEDDTALRTLLTEILELEGYEVITARDGFDALNKLNNRLPVLILLDLMMPEMDGIALLEELERRNLRSKIPIIVISADHLAEKKLRHVRPEGYLPKPLEIEDLLVEVTRFVPRRSHSSGTHPDRNQIGGTRRSE